MSYRKKLISDSLAERFFFVRPSGTTYGTGDGTSYANAWSGFAAVNQALVVSQGAKLAVCGEHLQLLDVTQDGLQIVGNHPAQAGTINAQSLRRCLNVINRNNVTVVGLTMRNGLSECAMNQTVSSIVYDGCIFDTSTNQTVQNQGTYCQVTYNNCTFQNGFDDGISLHDTATVVIANNCTFQNNDQGVNAISTGVCTINDCNFLNNVIDVKADDSSDFTVNRCFLRSQVIANSAVATKLNNCVMISGETRISSIGSIVVSDCSYLNNSFIGTFATDISKVQIQRCYFEMNLTVKIQNSNNGVFNLDYCTFRHMGSTNVYSVRTTGTGTSTINNCTFIGNSNVGRGIQAEGRINVRNTIFSLLNLCVNPNGASGIVTFSHCNTFGNTTVNINQNGGTFSNTNIIAGNPLFVTVPTDLRLQSGSPGIGSGATLVNSLGMLSANWGDASTPPSVVTKEQTVPWTIGAFI